jgi:hypothetical protein
VGEGLFFFRSRWVLAFKYLFLVIEGVGDTCIYLKFCIYIYNWLRVNVLGFRVKWVGGGFHLMPLC